MRLLGALARNLIGVSGCMFFGADARCAFDRAGLVFCVSKLPLKRTGASGKAEGSTVEFSLAFRCLNSLALYQLVMLCLPALA